MSVPAAVLGLHCCLVCTLHLCFYFGHSLRFGWSIIISRVQEDLLAKAEMYRNHVNVEDWVPETPISSQRVWEET